MDKPSWVSMDGGDKLQFNVGVSFYSHELFKMIQEYVRRDDVENAYESTWLSFDPSIYPPEKTQMRIKIDDESLPYTFGIETIIHNKRVSVTLPFEYVIDWHIRNRKEKEDVSRTRG